MFARTLGQYEEGDYDSYATPTGSYDWASIGSSWGMTPEQIQASQAPVAGISVAGQESGGGGGIGSLLSSILSPLIGAGAQVGSAYLLTQKPSGGVTYIPGTTTAPATGTAIQQAGIGSIFSGSMLPILGIIGIGAFLVMRGKKRKK